MMNPLLIALLFIAVSTQAFQSSSFLSSSSYNNNLHHIHHHHLSSSHRRDGNSPSLFGRRQRSTTQLPAVNTLLSSLEQFSYAFVGGTIGVVSVAIIVELRKTLQDQTTEACPYCLGNGEILCASCCGSRVVEGKTCSVCEGRGMVTCLNCKGDGRITPIILQSRALRDPEFATDGISIDSP
eukprot:gene4105-4498_t